MTRNWRNIDYLKSGDTTQQKLYESIQSAAVLDKLKAFDPIITGTYPIGIYLPGSDIDITCEYGDKEQFIGALRNFFRALDNFSINTKKLRGIESVIARFEHNGFLFEIFGQPLPVENQYSYRHMLIEHNLLESNDSAFKEKILKLKMQGYSTEEAFVSLLGIVGDPYEELLKVDI